MSRFVSHQKDVSFLDQPLVIVDITLIIIIIIIIRIIIILMMHVRRRYIPSWTRNWYWIRMMIMMIILIVLIVLIVIIIIIIIISIDEIQYPAFGVPSSVAPSPSSYGDVVVSVGRIVFPPSYGRRRWL